MLKYLKIKNLAVIDSAELELENGFICLTGESGAGKSVLVDSLLLLGGNRASTDLVRTGCDKATIEACFEIPDPDPELELLERGELFLRREVTKDGKSRAFVNGVMVPNSLLSRYGAFAFEIHGQHGQQRLLKDRNHLEIFDDQTGLKPRMLELEQQIAAFKGQLRKFRELEEGEAQRLREIDFLRLQINEIEGVNPNDDDLELDFRLKKARNREQIRAQRGELAQLLDRGLISDLKCLQKLTIALSEYHENLKPYVDQVDSLAITLSDLQAEVDFWDEGADEDRLDKLEARESELNRLFMKYGRDLSEVLAEFQRLKDQLDHLESMSGSLDSRWQALEKAYAELRRARQALHQARDKAVVQFDQSVETGLRDLSLTQARFHVENHWPEWSPKLVREVNLSPVSLRFLFSSNPGEPLKPLAKVASGGELSRVLLALINAFSRPSGRLLVFDEIDAGLGGETAHAVGAKLATLGKTHQVFCVTHFAQVARFAGQQIKIEKASHDGRVFTTLQVCDYNQRIAELARLMGGDAQAENLRDHARELLG